MKYQFGWIAPKGRPEAKVRLKNKPHLPKYRKISNACFIGAIAMSIYGLCDNFFRAGVEGHDIAECEALEELGLMNRTPEGGSVGDTTSSKPIED